jgi:hypothetical protein
MIQSKGVMYRVGVRDRLGLGLGLGLGKKRRNGTRQKTTRNEKRGIRQENTTTRQDKITHDEPAKT